MTTTPESPRSAALRQVLVHAANAPQPTGPRRRAGLVVAAVAAFAVAGAGSGVISAAAFAASRPATTNAAHVDTSNLQDAGTQFFDDAGGMAIGVAFVVVGSGTTDIDMGTRPDGANSVTYAAECLDKADVTFSLGSKHESLLCGPNHPGETPLGGVARVAVGAGKLTLHVESSGGYAIWAAWSSGAPAPDPDPSAAQAAELADGVVTEAEYLEAFGRFSACMAERGYPLRNVDTSVKQPRFGYGPDNPTEAEVAAAQKVVLYCYPYEFAYVASAWSKAHPQ